MKVCSEGCGHVRGVAVKVCRRVWSCEGVAVKVCSEGCGHVRGVAVKVCS